MFRWKVWRAFRELLFDFRDFFPETFTLRIHVDQSFERKEKGTKRRQTCGVPRGGVQLESTISRASAFSES